MISATLMTKGINPWIAVGITFICCILVGVLNGQLVAKCKLPPFIATLGTMTIARGIAQIVNNNYNTDSIGDGAQAFRDFFYYGKFLGVYNTIWIAVVLWILFNFLLSKTARAVISTPLAAMWRPPVCPASTWSPAQQRPM